MKIPWIILYMYLHSILYNTQVTTDVGPTLYKCYTNVLCLLDTHIFNCSELNVKYWVQLSSMICVCYMCLGTVNVWRLLVRVYIYALLWLLLQMLVCWRSCSSSALGKPGTKCNHASEKNLVVMFMGSRVNPDLRNNFCYTWKFIFFCTLTRA